MVGYYKYIMVVHYHGTILVCGLLLHSSACSHGSEGEWQSLSKSLFRPVWK